VFRLYKEPEVLWGLGGEKDVLGGSFKKIPKGEIFGLTAIRKKMVEHTKAK